METAPPSAAAGGTNPPASSPTAERYHAFDALRAGAMLLGIFFHASLAYIEPNPASWIVQDTERSIGFAALMRREGFSRFEEALEEFRLRFDDAFIRHG